MGFSLHEGSREKCSPSLSLPRSFFFPSSCFLVRGKRIIIKGNISDEHTSWATCKQCLFSNDYRLSDHLVSMPPQIAMRSIPINLGLTVKRVGLQKSAILVVPGKSQIFGLALTLDAIGGRSQMPFVMWSVHYRNLWSFYSKTSAPSQSP